MSFQYYKSIDNISEVGDFAFNRIIVRELILTDGEIHFVDDRDNLILDVSAGRNLQADAKRNSIYGHRAAAFALNSQDAVLIGNQCAEFLSTGQRNVAVGSRCGLNLGPSSENVLIGFETAEQVNEGKENVIIGNGAMSQTQNSEGNISIGYLSALSLQGTKNIVVGNRSGNNLLQGNNNVILQGEHDLKTGNNNLIIGSLSNLENGNNNIFLNYSGSALPSNLSNFLGIGNLINGDMQSRVLNFDSRVTMQRQDTLLLSSVSPQNIANTGIFVNLSNWDVKVYEKGSGLTQSLGVITAQYPGVYIIKASCSFASDNSNVRLCILKVNNNTVAKDTRQGLDAPYTTDFNLQTVVHLQSNDQVYVQVAQTSTNGPLQCTSSSFAVSLLH
jgi:hypothetical protein